jgi:hypothetical protein
MGEPHGGEIVGDSGWGRETVEEAALILANKVAVEDCKRGAWRRLE